MRLRWYHLVLVCCTLAIAAESVHAQPPFRRRALNTLSAADQLELRQLIMGYLTAPVIALHLTPGIHLADEFFLSWHRGYIGGLEAYLMTQPNGTKYVPLPKYDPTFPIPNAFFNALVAPGSAVVSGYPNLVNQNPGGAVAIPGNICTVAPTANSFGAWIDGPHGSVHVAIGGSMGSITNASATAVFYGWHGYIDDHYRYYQCVCQGAEAKDLYMKDDVNDVGAEPNTTAPGGVYWGSPDIWVRNTQDPYNGVTGKYDHEDDVNRHQNPAYNPLAPNYVYVRIRNLGCARVNAGEVNLRTYWSRISTSASVWPTDWDNALPIGDKINAAAIAVPALDPGQQWVAEIPWNVPDPAQYPGEPERYCLLARLESVVDPMTFVEVPSVLTNVQNNNNIAWRNVDVVETDPSDTTEPDTCNRLYISEVYGSPQYDEVYFNYDPNPGMYVRVDLGEDLYNIWRDGGYAGDGYDIGYPDDYVVEITEPGGYLGNLNLQYDTRYDPCIRTYVRNPDYGGDRYGEYDRNYPVYVTQYEAYEGQGPRVVGGAVYEVRARRDYEAVPGANVVLNAAVTPASCPDAANGAITLVVSQQGAGQYTYWWSNGQSTRDIHNLKPGKYDVIIRNGNGAIDRRTYTVGSNSTLAVDMDAQLSHCGNNDGIVQCGVTGGLQPYQYQWRRNGILIPVVGPIVNNASPGAYEVRVTDMAGCIIYGKMNLVDEWDMLTVNVETTPASGPNIPDGTARAVCHGMPGFIYRWSNGATTDQIVGLLPGPYWVDVTDMSGAGCTKRRFFNITAPQGLQGVDLGEALLGNAVIVPNPASTGTELRYSMKRAGAVRIELYDNLGRLVDVMYDGYIAAGEQVLPIETSGIASGTYAVRIATHEVTTTLPLTVVR